MNVYPAKMQEKEIIDQGSEPTDFTGYEPNFTEDTDSKSTTSSNTITSLNGASIGMIFLTLVAFGLKKK